MFKKEILENQKKIIDLKLIERKFDIEEILSVLNLNKIIALIWWRRSWKTFLSFYIVKKLIEKNFLDIENIIYLDFSWIIDKDLDLDLVLDNYFTLFSNKKPFFLLDEVQEINNFPEKLINILNKWYKVIITGSNAHLLSKELSTILRWKVYTKEIFPLNFEEYLYFKNINISKNDLILNYIKYKNYFLEFLKWWWFPEIVLTENEIVKENILKTYLDVMIYKDLVDRYNIKNDYNLSYFIRRILFNFTKELNINKIFNELKSNWIKIWKDSLYNFYYYLQNIYFIDSLKNNWAKVKWLTKVYLIDVSFGNLVWNQDFGKRFENFVFLELRKKYSEIYFLNKNYEIDFYIPEKKSYIQVIYELNFDNLERETKNLLKYEFNKYVIYFEKQKWLNLPKEINFIEWKDFIFNFSL